MSGSTVFNKPDYRPAISANSTGQQAVQQATFATRGELSGGRQADPVFDLAYEAYKLTQEAKGLPAVSKHQFLMMYRHQRLTDI
jgi:hypothetical protein